VFAANSRTPDDRVGDLDAQVGANAIGVARLAELADAPLRDPARSGCSSPATSHPPSAWRTSAPCISAPVTSSVCSPREAEAGATGRMTVTQR